MKTIKLNNTIGITGISTSSVKKNGNSTTYEITKTGTMNSHFIPSVIIFCEDELAKDIITYSISELSNGSFLRGSFKFIINGSWENIITSLAGSLLYSEELSRSGNTKFLSTVGIIDGDISEKEISDVISNCYKGDGIPRNLKEIIKKIEKNITSFKIPEKTLDRKIKGKPEYNIKSMLEEITEEDIDRIIGPNLNRLNGYLEKSKTKEGTTAIDHELFFIRKEKEELLNIIKKSKKIGRKRFNKLQDGRYILDYHSYFRLLRESIGSEYYHIYDCSRSTLFQLHRIIIKYNKTRWDEYVSPVTSFLEAIAEEQRKRFSHNTFNNEILD